MTMCVVEAAIEAPHVVYPKGPVRKIKTFRETEDAVAGAIVLVTLECGHSATLVGPNLNQNSIVRCPMCFFDRRKTGGETVIDNLEKNV
jgi:hypothetical protein